LSTGQVVPAYCRAWKCLRCGPKKARLVMAVAYRTGNTHFVTLTNVGTDWQQIRNRVKQFVFELRSEDRPFWFVWCVEPFASRKQNHIHGLASNIYVEAELMRIVADRVGLGRRVGIEDARTDGAAHYAIKAGLYSVKGVGGGPDTYRDALELNGGRLVHWSRRAFNGLNYGEAKDRYLTARRQGAHDPGPWVREPIGGTSG
jgi:hypothetical protein